MCTKGLHKVAPHFDFGRGAVHIEGNLIYLYFCFIKSVHSCTRVCVCVCVCVCVRACMHACVCVLNYQCLNSIRQFSHETSTL